MNCEEDQLFCFQHYLPIQKKTQQILLKHNRWLPSEQFVSLFWDGLG